MTKKRLAVVLIAALMLVAGVVYVLTMNRSSAPDGYKKVKGYNHIEPGEVTCLALTPSCGYCPGEVIEKECYVKKDAEY